MALIPVNKDTLGGKRLKPIASYAFLAKAPLCEIVVGEFPHVAPNYPIFFIDQAGKLVPVALFALQNGENLFVEGNGTWSGAYMPAAIRRHPFSLAQAGANGSAEPVLMIDDSTGLLSDSEGEALFGESAEQEMDSPVGRALRLIVETNVQTEATRSLVDQISQLGLIDPISLSMQKDGQQQDLTGLSSITEQKLKELPDADFLALRHSGALSLIYLQLGSLGQMGRLQARLNQRELAEQGFLPVELPTATD